MRIVYVWLVTLAEVFASLRSRHQRLTRFQGFRNRVTHVATREAMHIAQVLHATLQVHVAPTYTHGRPCIASIPDLNRSSRGPNPDPCPPGYTFPVRRRPTQSQSYLRNMLPRTITAAVAHHNHHHPSKSAHAATMANFAPYQDIPESTRVLSPLASPRASLDRPRIISPPTRTYEQHDYFGADDPEPDVERAVPQQQQPTAFSRRSREDVDMFTTSLGWRLDYEAMLAYLLLPPAGGVFLLVMEHQSDYVRFHAWQSSLLFAFVFVIHVIFSWSSFISWVLFVGDVAGIGYLTWRAYLDGMLYAEGDGVYLGEG
jgi:uncharacterized membrane protein